MIKKIISKFKKLSTIRFVKESLYGIGTVVLIVAIIASITALKDKKSLIVFEDEQNILSFLNDTERKLLIEEKSKLESELKLLYSQRFSHSSALSQEEKKRISDKIAEIEEKKRQNESSYSKNKQELDTLKAKMSSSENLLNDMQLIIKKTSDELEKVKKEKDNSEVYWKNYKDFLKSSVKNVAVSTNNESNLNREFENSDGKFFIAGQFQKLLDIIKQLNEDNSKKSARILELEQSLIDESDSNRLKESSVSSIVSIESLQSIRAEEYEQNQKSISKLNAEILDRDAEILRLKNIILKINTEKSNLQTIQESHEEEKPVIEIDDKVLIPEKNIQKDMNELDIDFWKERKYSWVFPLKGGYVDDPGNIESKFGYERPDSNASNPGIFIIPKIASGVKVLSMTDGVIINYYSYVGGTYAMEIKNDDGTIARYCYISSSLKTGTRVSKAQVIGIVLNVGSRYGLHIELYQGTLGGALSNINNTKYRFVEPKNYMRRGDLQDPSGIMYLNIIY